MIRRVVIIINASSEDIVKTNFASVELKDARSFSVKLQLVSVN